jgi:hypothetical protein
VSIAKIATGFEQGLRSVPAALSAARRCTRAGSEKKCDIGVQCVAEHSRLPRVPILGVHDDL